MVENVDDFEYIITSSEFEALVLECSLIKQHRPKYNILLKDDKGYAYIKVTKGDWGRISAEKNNSDPTAMYIGPYISHYYVKTQWIRRKRYLSCQAVTGAFPETSAKAVPVLIIISSSVVRPAQASCPLKSTMKILPRPWNF